MKMKNTSLKSKLIGFIIVLLVLANLGLGIPSYIVAKNELDLKGRTILENGVKMALSVIEQYAVEVEEGLLTEGEAQEKVKEYLIGPMNSDGTRQLNTPIDLGENGYFLAYDKDGTEVMHPTLEGVNVLDVVSYDEEDLFIVREQLKIGIEGGFLEYNWVYPNDPKIGRKISYSKYDPNWGWTLVSTAYTSDFNKSASSIMYDMLMSFIVILLFGVMFVSEYMDKLTKPVSMIINSMKNSDKHTLKKVEETNRNDELMKLVIGYNQMIDSLEFQSNEVKRREKQLKQLAYVDDLTGLANLNMMEEYVDKKLEEGIDNGFLILLDIKELKILNSIYGLSYGDEMLCWASESLKENKPNGSSLVARLGGNEFGIWVQGDDENMLIQWIKDLHDFWDREYYSKRVDVKIAFSVAYVKNDDLNENFNRILQKANTAIQYVKTNDLDFVKYNQEIFNILEKEDILKRHAEQGLIKDEFYPVYQEKVLVESEEVVGVEALARWDSEAIGFVSPGEFIPVMNKTKLILEFTEKMVDYVLADYNKLVKKYNSQVTVSINISPLFFIGDNFVDFMLMKASQYKVPMNCIILEITEDILIRNLNTVSSKMKDLREAGFKISLDDFGTGYSSLNYLQKIVLDEIKIDKSFIDHIVDDPMAYKLFKSIIDVINNFGSTTVAEGVETKEQIEKVKSAGCKIVQGYYYSKPEKLNM